MSPISEATAQAGEKTVTANTAPTRYIEVSDTKIAYRILNEGAGIPLVLLPRFRATMDDWDPNFLDYIAQTRSVVLFDNFGVGRSEGNSSDTIQGMANDAAQIIRALDLSKVDVLGWSMGGMVTYALAMQHENLVRKAISAGSTPGLIATSSPMSEKVGTIVRKPVNDTDDFLYLFFPDTEEGRKLGLTHLTRLNKRSEPTSPPVSAETFMTQAKAVIVWRTQTGAYPTLNSVKTPFLIANGEDDVMIPAEDSRVAAKALPGSELKIYPNAGHGFLFQDDINFAVDVVDFLSK
ncbi:alpha/beta fold hydrolase [Sneathiella glossodoripedis]|uniref:alpha/beta fold hydrolase n=1 Tax=Sneathiella glossodoripedis TaxID=418853 RepID=UPI000688B487|nr:alpha/beta hydrolase [Sneathiella glossodoripedis]